MTCEMRIKSQMHSSNNNHAFYLNGPAEKYLSQSNFKTYQAACLTASLLDGKSAAYHDLFMKMTIVCKFPGFFSRRELGSQEIYMNPWIAHEIYDPGRSCPSFHWKNPRNWWTCVKSTINSGTLSRAISGANPRSEHSTTICHCVPKPFHSP